MAENSFFITAPCNNIYESKIPIDTDSASALCFEVTKDGKKLFMKQLRDEFLHIEDYRILFRKEYELGHNISHPNIVNYESFHEDEDSCYLLMDYIAGETLDCFIASHPDYFSSQKNLSRFSNQLLSALKCLHENHVVYSDLKPQNIMLSQVNNDVVLIDLGFCFADAYSNTAGATKEFSAPEQRKNGTLETTTDIYCFGKVLEFLNKNRPSHLPKKYRSIMAKCLKEQQADRWQSVDEILAKINNNPNAWVKWLMEFMVVVTPLVGYIVWQKSSETALISKDIVSINYINYSNFNKKDKTCEAIGEDSLKNHTIYIRELINYQGEEYKVTSIAHSAFKDLKHIKTVHIPDGLKSIGGDAFFGCDSILIINIPNSVTTIGDLAFYGCKGVTELILSQNLKEIPTAGFVATKISQLNIPEGVEVIKLDAFALCPDIKEVKIPSTVKHLERGVFYNCLGLQRIELPASLERADEYLFYGCECLKDIYIHAIVPPRALALHRNPSQITLHVPAESVEAYRNAPYWQDMNIVAIK